MKRKGLVFLTLLLVFALVACGGNSGGGEDNKAKEPDKKQEETKAPETDKPLKVALLIGSLGDMSFNDSANSGIERAKKDLGIDAQVIEYGNDPQKYEPTLIDTAEQGYDIVIMPTNLQVSLENNAEAFPDTTFIMFDGEVDWTKGDFKNVYCITYKANEASYLGGYVSAALSESKVLGFLGGIDQPVINDFLVGFIQGAQEYDPDIKVITNYAGSYSDPSKGKELTIAMINNGADMAFNVAGGTGVGLIEACVENGKYVLGVDSDQALMYEKNGKQDYANSIPTSVLKNVGDSLYRALDLYKKGELKIGEAETLGIKENGVGLADNSYYQEMVPEEVRKNVENIKQQIIDGKIEVNTAIGMNTDEIAAIRDSARP